MAGKREATAKVFDRSFVGSITVQGDPGYDAARAVWNGVVDCRPALIAHCRCVADVVSAVNLARETGVPVAVRAGGHSVAGFSTCDEGVVIDLSAMREVVV